MKHRLIWLQGGSVSHRWTIPLIGQSSEHNFRRVERDISCLCKLFQGILVLYIKSKRLGSQEILSRSARWQWAVLQQLNVWWLLCLLRPHVRHVEAAIKQLTLNDTVMCEVFLSSEGSLLHICSRSWFLIRFVVCSISRRSNWMSKNPIQLTSTCKQACQWVILWAYNAPLCVAWVWAKPGIIIHIFIYKRLYCEDWHLYL